MFSVMNEFLNTLKKSSGSALTENGAASYASTGKELVNQFFKAANFRGRDFSIVFEDQAKLWGENPVDALRFPFYLRLITRVSKLYNGEEMEKVQRGAGARDESFKRLLWIAYNHPEHFYKNLWLLPAIGSWKDLWTLLYLDIEYSGKEGKLDRYRVFSLIVDGLATENTCNLVKKFLPRVRTEKKCHTTWAKNTNYLAKEFINFLDGGLPNGLSQRGYRKLKSSGTAHLFQQFITKGQYDKIDFKNIPGKALLNMVSSKFLENHNLAEKYLEWVKSQPVVKFNGYPYELGAKLSHSSKYFNFSFGYYQDNNPYTLKDKALAYTIDKQFENLLATGKKDNGAITGKVWCALDTSGSMSCPISGTNITALDVCKSLGIYFSTLNEGAFHKNVVMFDDTSRIKELKGSFSEMWKQIPDNAMGSTNFQSVVDCIVEMRLNHPEIPLSDYPTTLLVVSDMQFNPTNCYHLRRFETTREMTNIEASKAKLATAFPQEFVDEFKFIWWNVASRETEDFPATLDQGGAYFFSGFDGAIISFLLGGDAKVVDKESGELRAPTAEEVIQTALDQEVLQLVV